MSVDPNNTLQALNTDVVKIGNKLYKIEHVGQCDNLKAELEEFYKQAAEIYRNQVIDLERANIEEDARRMHEHIQRQIQRRNTTNLTIPERLKGRDGVIRFLTTYNDNLYECRHITYCPNKVDLNRDTLNTYISSGALDEEAVELLNNEYENIIDNNYELTIHFNTELYAEMLVGRNVNHSRNGLIAFKGANHHTMSPSALPATICTGNASTDQVWSMDDAAFTEYINHINSFSLGASAVPMRRPSHKDTIIVDWRDLWNGTWGNITSVSATRRAQWTTQ